MKKILSVLLSYVILLSLVCLHALAATDEFAGGSGTEEDPYQVATPEQLNNVRNYLSAHFIQICDIDMSEATSEGGIYWNNGTGWIPIGRDSKQFVGVYDGGNYKINGLKIYKFSKFGSYNYASLFASLGSTACIKNVNMTNGYCQLSPNSSSNEYFYIGGIFGWANLSTSDTKCIIENCINENTITVTDNNSNEQYVYIGGIGGRITYGTVLKCRNKGNISVNNPDNRVYIGGIVGGAFMSSTSQSYNSGNLDCDGYLYLSVGGIAGSNSHLGYVKECCNSGDIGVLENEKNSEWIGGIVGQASMSSAGMYDCYNAGDIVAKNAVAFSGTYIGGLAGIITNNSGTDIKTSYNSGNIGGADGIGYFAEESNSGKYSGGYYCYSISSSPINLDRTYIHNSKNLSSKEICQKESFAGFDFETVWDISPDINDGMPYLRNVPIPEEKGTVLENVTEDKTQKTISFDITNDSSSLLSFVAVCAIYDENNTLIECKTETVSELNAYTEKSFSFSFEKEWHSYKIMFLENLKNMKPISISEE